MLKGRTEIILTDVNTGKVERHVDENLVTGAVANVINNPAYGLNSRGLNTNIATGGNNTPINDLFSLFGGIKCYPNAIPEDADHFYEPISHEPTAYSGNDGYTGSDSKRGSFNSIESGAVRGGYRFVFDFPTSAGNGDISSVCLTNAQGGKSHYSNWSTVLDGNGDDRAGFKSTINLGDEGNFSYCRKVVVNTNDAIIMTNNTATKLVKIKARALDIGFNTSLTPYVAGAINNTETETFTLPYNPIAFMSCFGDNTFYTIKSMNATTINWEHFDVDFNSLGTGSWAFSGVSMLTDFNKWTVIPICKQKDGNYYIIIPNSAKNAFLRLNINNNADVRSIPATVTLMEKCYGTDFDGNFYGASVIIDKEGVAHTMDFANWMLPHKKIGTWAFGVYHYYGRLYFGGSVQRQYLATINNLSKPVQKTPDKTMKIIYTLTEAQ